jgi:hypothetical protein
MLLFNFNDRKHQKTNDLYFCTGLCILSFFKVNFAYVEHHEKKNALVKLRLCPDCSAKLNYHSKKRLIKKEKVKKEYKEKEEEHHKKKEKRKRKQKSRSRSQSPSDSAPEPETSHIKEEPPSVRRTQVSLESIVALYRPVTIGFHNFPDFLHKF